MSKKNKVPKEQIKRQIIQKSTVTDFQKAENKAVITHSKAFDLKHYITVATILIITYFSFSAVKNYEFVNWDDPNNFYENKLITSLNKENFGANSKEIFKTDVIGNYNPLAIWTFALEHKYRGEGEFNGLKSPGGWHSTNLFLHLISVLLVFLISRKLGLGLIGAAFTTILFGIHPMRVESVAWVTERKDVLFGLFFLASFLCYINFKTNKKIINLVLVYLFFILSLFSKIQAVTLPLSLIAVDYLITKEFNWKSVWNKIPLFALSILFGVYGIYVLKDNNSLEANVTTYPFWQRTFIGSYSYMVYLIKSIVPYEMSPLYPYPAKIPAGFYPTMLLLPITLYALYQGFVKKWTVLVFGLLFFIFNIFFLLQILAAGQGFIADRFTYIAYFGLFYCFGYLVDKASQSVKYKIPIIATSVFITIFYIYITKNQVKIWENSGTLWTHVLKYYDKITTPYGNRANYYRSMKRYDLAINDYASAIALKPEPQTLNSRSKLYFDISGNSKDTLMMALNDLNRAIELKPNDGEFLINRGAMYAKLGDFDQSLASLNEGLKIKPDQISGYLNRSLIYNLKNDHENAIKDFDEYLKYDPYKSNIIFERGMQKRMLNRLEESIADYTRAIELGDEVNIGLFYYERATSYYLLKNMGKAKADYLKAISLGYKNINPQFKEIMEKSAI
ncbi:MAG: tetratricopeptide repeat protein [Bacteroidota bacterium]